MKVKIKILMELIAALIVVGIFLQYSFPFAKQKMAICLYILGLALLILEILYLKIEVESYYFVGGLLILGLINMFFIGNTSLSVLIKMVVQHATIAILFLKQDKLHKWIWYGLSIIIVLFVENAWIHSPDRYILFDGISRNYISIFLLLALFFSLVIIERENSIVPRWMGAIFLAFCILGIGRGGIISGVLFFSLNEIHRLFTDEHKNKRTNKIIKIIILIIAMLKLVFMFEKFLVSVILDRFVNNATAEVSNNGRMRIYLLYFNTTISSTQTFLLGVNITEVSSNLNFVVGSNLHCSYLQLHAMFGIGGVAFLFKYIFKSIKYHYKKCLYQSLILFIVFLVRIASDYAICGFVTDIILFYYIFIPMAKEGKKCVCIVR